MRTSNGSQFQMDGAVCRKARAPMFSIAAQLSPTRRSVRMAAQLSPTRRSGRITAQLSPTRRSAKLTAENHDNDDFEQSRDNTVTFRYGDAQSGI